MKHALVTKTKEENSILSNGLNYPAADDIYAKAKLQQAIDPENTSALKELNEKQNSSNEKSFEEDISGNDLDVPGSEADDADELIGSEDEENNYYSLGRDNQNIPEEYDFRE